MIVKSLGSKNGMEVYSKIGEGTSFTFYILNNNQKIVYENFNEEESEV